MLKKTILILVPAIVWLFFTGSMNLLNIFLGLLLSYILFLIYGNFSVSNRRKIKILKILNLFAYFIWELILANLRVALEVVRPKLSMTPAIIEVPLEITRPYELLIFTGMVTLTPGSLTINFTDDNKTVYIHTMYYTSADEFRSYIKNGFEKKIIEAF